MIVITLTNCPSSLRGDLTKWLLEINQGVYVGRVSARVREKLWQRVQDCAKTGKVTMVYSTNNEQRMDFRVHNSEWEPIDFDGLKLIMRPSPARIKKLEERRGFSNAAKHHKAKIFSAGKQGSGLPATYVVAIFTQLLGQVNATGVYRVAAIKVVNSEFLSGFQSELYLQKKTGEEEKKQIVSDTLHSFLVFIGDMPLVSHKASSVSQILRTACRQSGLPLFSNRFYDTEAIARRKVKGVDDYKLDTLLASLGIELSGEVEPPLQECFAVKLLYDKLIEMGKSF